MSEKNKMIMRRAVEEVWNQGKVELLEELVSSDFVIHAPQADIHGRAGARQYLTMLRTAFPDIHFTIEDQFADGDRVMTRWNARGTHRGDFQGIPPTGRQVKLAGTDIDRIVAGRVVECWTSTDDLGLLRQLGVLSQPAAPESSSLKGGEAAGRKPPSAWDPAWDSIASGYDEFVTPSHTQLSNQVLRLAGLRPGMRFLDVAAGSGALAIPAARLGAQVLATDGSAAMLEHLRARARREGLDVETRVMDGHHLELEDNRFDISASQFGVMLFAELPRALLEMTRVTRPGGKVVVVTFGNPNEVEFLTFFIRAIQAADPGASKPPLNPPPLVFQIADPEVFRRRMDEAGLKDVRIETTSEKLVFTSGQALWSWLLGSNPLATTMTADLSGQQRAAAQAAMEQMIRERAGEDGQAVLTNLVYIGTGTKPG